MKKKIYIGDKITTPSWEEWKGNNSSLTVYPEMCSKIGIVVKENLFPSGTVSVLVYPYAIPLSYPKKELETLLNCEFVNERRPEETYEEIYQKPYKSPFKREEPMKKLKTRDEIYKMLSAEGFSRVEKEEKFGLAEITDFLTKEGIIEVAEDEISDWELVCICLQEIIKNEDNPTDIRMRLSVIHKKIIGLLEARDD